MIHAGTASTAVWCRSTDPTQDESQRSASKFLDFQFLSQRSLLRRGRNHSGNTAASLHHAPDDQS